MTGNKQLTLANSPTNFVRFVYCLGYGEPNFVGQRLAGNTGTWQYWKLLSSCAHGPASDAFAPVLKRYSPSFQSRLKAKIAHLERLRQLGVWLLDASILALYAPGATRLHAGEYERLLRCCWEHHIGPTIVDANPHSVIVIGRGVQAALRKSLRPSLSSNCTLYLSRRRGFRLRKSVQCMRSSIKSAKVPHQREVQVEAKPAAAGHVHQRASPAGSKA